MGQQSNRFTSPKEGHRESTESCAEEKPWAIRMTTRRQDLSGQDVAIRAAGDVRGQQEARVPPDILTHRWTLGPSGKAYDQSGDNDQRDLVAGRPRERAHMV